MLNVRESLASLLESASLIVVGSGLYGATIAERAAAQGHIVALIERRNHIGGNTFSYIEQSTGVEVHKYGSHLFHTSNPRVWEYVNLFDSFNDYRHVVWAHHRGRLYPMPINLMTISTFFDRHLSPQEARELLESQKGTLAIDGETSLETKAISLIGKPLYEAFVKGYTAKQWQSDPKLLPESVISRLPVRMNLDHRYFSDRWEGLPLNGYTAMLSKMLSSPNIYVHTDTDYFDIKHLVPFGTPIIYTGPIDRYFDYNEGLLGWRTLDFDLEVADVEDFQGAAVINYVDEDVPYTRVHEFKHLHPERTYTRNKTVIMYEHSRFAGRNDEPYYPVNTAEDRKKLLAYRERARAEKGVFFGGRLGSYQYLDMHMAVASALTAWDNEVRDYLLSRQED